VDASKPVRWFDISAEAMAVGTVVFQNGVRANIQAGGPDMDQGSGVRTIGTDGFIEVGPILQVTGQTTVFAVGDISTADSKSAAFAGYQAAVVADNINALAQGVERLRERFGIGDTRGCVTGSVSRAAWRTMQMRGRSEPTDAWRRRLTAAPGQSSPGGHEQPSQPRSTIVRGS